MDLLCKYYTFEILTKKRQMKERAHAKNGVTKA